MAIAYIEARARLTMDGCDYELSQKLNTETWKLTEIKTHRSIEMTEHELLSKYNQGEITLRGYRGQDLAAHQDQVQGQIFDHVPECYRELARERLYYVRKILVADLPAYTHGHMTPVIEAAHAALTSHQIRKPHWGTVLRWLKRYESGGRDLAALIPRHRAKGRKPRQVPSEIEHVIVHYVDRDYMSTNRPSRNAVLEDINNRIRKDNRTRPLGGQLPEAEAWMLDRVIARYSAFDRQAARHGIQSARAKYRSVLHKVTADRPLERVQMDHTQLDLFVLDEAVMLPRGRPWLTVCLDLATRCVLGVHITFYPPGHMSVARCLQNSVLPKTGLREQYPSLRHDWECYGAPEFLIVDNGLPAESRKIAA